jgi:hypothetical protein
MTKRLRCLSSVLATLLMLGGQHVFAQQNPCPAPPNLEASTTSLETSTALDAVSKVLAKVGIDINFRSTRDSIFRDNPSADQAIIVLTMANTLCEMIWSDPSLSGAEKATRFQSMMEGMLSRALGPTPVARTDTGETGQLGRPLRKIMLASLDTSALILAGNEPQFELPKSQTGFLRERPFYVTIANKYFVIVGSAKSRETGINLMKRLKAKAPQYDFALYAPYGSNPYYGVMMATWVPKDVALEALEAARRDVVPDAYLWACRSTGDSC